MVSRSLLSILENLNNIREVFLACNVLIVIQRGGGLGLAELVLLGVYYEVGWSFGG